MNYAQLFDTTIHRQPHLSHSFNADKSHAPRSYPLFSNYKNILTINHDLLRREPIFLPRANLNVLSRKK